MFSNRYIFVYSSVMVIVIAISLTLVSVGLKPFQTNNIRIEKMRNILTSANIESTNKNAESLFKKYIVESFTINSKGDTLTNIDAFSVELAVELKKKSDERSLPIYKCINDKKEVFYIVPVRGKGLWGPVWGYLSFKSDMNTIAGSMFDHKGETPGLGAEISTAEFQKQFINKKINDEKGTFRSIAIIKGGAKEDDPHGVDAISGGTITSNGVAEMIKNGLSDYTLFFNKTKKLKP